jgi:single-strand DNA-binding protein
MSDVRVPDLNTVTIAGRLTRDPELKYITSGRAVCELSIANTKYYKTRDGERKEDTTFVNATCWDKFAEYVGDNLRKGRPVIVEGRLKSESWEDKTSGQKRSKVYILASRVTPLDWENSESNESGGGRPRPAQESSRAPRDIEEPIPEDDIPF